MIQVEWQVTLSAVAARQHRLVGEKSHILLNESGFTLRSFHSLFCVCCGFFGPAISYWYDEVAQILLNVTVLPFSRWTLTGLSCLRMAWCCCASLQPLIITF